MKTKTFLWSTSESYSPIFGVYDEPTLTNQLSPASTTFNITGTFIYFWFNALPLEKGDVLVSAKFVVKKTSSPFGTFIITAKDLDDEVIDYSSDQGTIDTFYIDVTKLFNDPNESRVVGIRCPLLNDVLNVYGRGTNVVSNYTAPRLIIEYIPASEAVSNQKYIEGSLNDELSYSINIANSLLYLNKGLFSNLLPYNLSLKYNSYHIDNSFLFFPKGWRLNILESIAFDNNDIILTDSNLNNRRFTLADNSSDTYYDTSGSGMIIRYISNEYRLYQNLYNQDTYKVFGSNNYVSSIHLPYSKTISISYTTSSITITDYNNNVVTVTDTTSGGYHYIVVSLNSITLSCKLTFITGSNFLSNIKELDTSDEIDVINFDFLDSDNDDYNLTIVRTSSNYALEVFYDDNKRIDEIQKCSIENSNIFHTLESFELEYSLLKIIITDRYGNKTSYQFDEELNFVQSYDANNSSPLIYKDEDEMNEFSSNFNNLIPITAYQYKDENNITTDIGTITLSSYSSSSKSLTLVTPSAINLTHGSDYILYISCSASNSIPLYKDRTNLFNELMFNSTPRKVEVSLTIYRLESGNKITIGSPIIKQFFVFNSSETRIISFFYPNDAAGIDITCTAQGTKGTYVFSNASLFKLKNNHQQVLYEVNLSNLVIDYIYWRGIKTLSYSNDKVYFRDIASNKLATIFNVPYYFVNKGRKLIKSNSVIQYSGIDENNNTITPSANALFAEYQYKEKGSDYCHTLSYLDSDNNYAFSLKKVIKYSLNNNDNEESEIKYFDANLHEASFKNNLGVVFSKSINSSGDIVSETINALNTSSYFETDYIYSNHRLTSTSYLGSSSVVSESNTYLGTTEQLLSHTDAKGVTYTYGYLNYKELNNIQVDVTTSSNKAYTKSVYNYDYLTNMNNNLNKFTFGYDKYNLLYTVNVSQLGRGEVDDDSSNDDKELQNEIRGPVNPDPPTFANLYERQNYLAYDSSGTFEIFKNHQIIHSSFDKYKHLSLIDYQNDNGASLAKAYFFYADLPLNSSINLNNVDATHPISDDSISVKSKLVKIIDNFSNRITTYTYDEEQKILSVSNKEGTTNVLNQTLSYDLFNRTKQEDIISSIANYKFANSKVSKFYSFFGSSSYCISTINQFKISNKYKTIKEEIPIQLLTNSPFDYFGRVTNLKVTFTSQNLFPTCVSTSYSFFNNSSINSLYIKKISYFLSYYEANNIQPTYINLPSDNFTYDANGNVTTVINKNDNTDTVNSSIQYTYDRLNRLIEEKDVLANTSKRYTYDNFGNIINVSKIGNVGGMEITLTSITFGYDSTYKDKLVSIQNDLLINNPTLVTYDTYLNPTSIGGATLTWTRGRMLSSYSTSDKNISFTYGYNGARTKKIVVTGNTSETHTYAIKGLKIVGEKITKTNNATHYIAYFYGLSGLIGFNYDNDSFIYVKNIFGDITHIYHSNGTLVATYSYDAFGNTTVNNLTSANIGDINPFRYRGYYFDKETGLYYCVSRYYKPDWRRWLNADFLNYLSNTEIGGINLFAYCFDNPILWVDDCGIRRKKGHNFPIDKKWSYRIDDKHKDSEHIHIDNYDDNLHFTQHKIGGRSRHPNKDTKGNPPRWVTDYLKDIGAWDWQHIDFSLFDNQIPPVIFVPKTLIDGGHTLVTPIFDIDAYSFESFPSTLSFERDFLESFPLKEIGISIMIIGGIILIIYALSEIIGAIGGIFAFA